MLGSAVVRQLMAEDCEIITGTRRDADLRDQAATRRLMEDFRADVVVLCAATVGGIKANIARPVDFMFDNLAIEQNIIETAHRLDINRLIFFGSSCMYPREAAQPIQENSIMTGPLEPTNEAYAIAKLAGLSLIKSFRRQYSRSYITAIPTNLYGPGDHFRSEDSHVVAAMLDRYHLAVIEGRAADPIWGSGKAQREFLYVDDAANAVVHLLKLYDDEEPINIAGGEDLTIFELAQIVANAVGYSGDIKCDESKPDGMALKALDPTMINSIGWFARTSFSEGIQNTYNDYKRFCVGQIAG
jgi:GDP-L-fucose synthase